MTTPHPSPASTMQVKTSSRLGRLRSIALVAIAASAASSTIALAAPPAQAARPKCPALEICTDSFALTNATQYWVAPEGVTQATVTLSGSQGDTGRSRAVGGLGARVVATVPVVPGQSYPVEVGGRGSDLDGNQYSQAGGYGGGGAATDCTEGTDAGAGGGGRSQFGAAGSDIYLVAAGGGGGAGRGYGRNGGDGGHGGNSGASGGHGGEGEDGARGGYGGDSGTAGGNGGFDVTGKARSGGYGAPGKGGDGAWGLGCGSLHPGGGGGGGGGFMGGGGGGAGENGHIANLITSMRGGGGGGGGGGSNFHGAAATEVSVTDGANSGSGSVSISYATRLDQTITILDSAPSDATYGQFHHFAARSLYGEVQFSAAGACTTFKNTWNTERPWSVTYTGVGTCTLTATQPGGEFYNPAPPVVLTYPVARSPQRIRFFPTWEEIPSRQVVGASVRLSPYVHGAADAPGDLKHRTTGPCTFVDNVLHFTGAGACTLISDAAGSDYYEPGQGILEFEVVKTPQEVVFASEAPTSPQVGDSYIPRAFARPDGGPITFRVRGGCELNTEGVVTFTRGGLCEITAHQVGTSEIEAAEKSQDITVQRGSQIVEFTSTPPSGAILGDAYEPAATGDSGEPVVFAVSGPCALEADGIVRFTGAGECVLTAHQAGNDHFLAGQQSQTIAVGRAPQVISFTTTPPSFTAINVTYQPAAVGGGSGNPVKFDVSGPCQYQTISYWSAVVITGPGDCVVTANQAGNADYEPAPPQSQTITTKKASQVVKFVETPPSSVAIGDEYQPSAVGGRSGEPVVFAVSGPCTREVDGLGMVRFTGAGQCVLTADQAGNADYEAAPQRFHTFTVAQMSQEVGFTTAAPPWTAVGDTYRPETTNGGSGEPVVFAVSGPCTLEEDGTVRFTGTGRCVVTANQAGNADYAPAPQQSETINVGRAWQDISFTSKAPSSVSIGDTYQPAATGGDSGEPVVFAVSGPCTLEEDGTVRFTGTGQCVVTANQAGNADYRAAPQQSQTITLGQESQVVAFTTEAPTGVSIGDTYQPAATGGGSGEPVVFAVSGPCTLEGDGTVRFSGAGECIVTAGQAGDADHAPADQVSQTITIGKASQMLEFTSTPPTSVKVGDAYVPAATGGISGKPVVFAVSGPCTLEADGTVRFTGAGNCTVTADQAGNTDYAAAAQQSQTITVGKDSQILEFTSETPRSASIGDTYQPAANGGGSGEPVVFGTTGPCTLDAGGTVRFTGAGECVLTADQAGNTDYAAAAQQSQTITIGKPASPVFPDSGSLGVFSAGL